MFVNGKQQQSIWLDNERIFIINQNKLPWIFETKELKTTKDIINAINKMEVRGAPLIGATAALGVYLAIKESKNENDFNEKINAIRTTRPTAINLNKAIDLVLKKINNIKNQKQKTQIALQTANKFIQGEIEACKRIGENGLNIIKEISKKKNKKTINILTHCNAGWLACIDHGTALSPIYLAHDKGIKVHIWVDETRPRNQGARLTAWELGQHGVPHTIIPDNTGGHLMQNQMVDLCIVGSDRTTKTGDTANKIGTYQKALAAKDNNIPFYVALPFSTIDFKLENGFSEIPIEQRTGEEVKYIEGFDGTKIRKLLLTPPDSPASNYGFDITPARLITGFITEKGVFKPGDFFNK